jgi:molybdate transport system ATP-binding protein
VSPTGDEVWRGDPDALSDTRLVCTAGRATMVVCQDCQCIQMLRTKSADARYVEVRLANLHLERQGRTILDHVNWTIRPGEHWVLAGGNGAGKTQLLKLIAGAVWPTPTGREVRQYRWRRELWPSPFEVQHEIGYVGPERQDKYERYGWNHTVEQVVGTGLYRTDIPLNPLTPEDRRRIGAVLGRLAIGQLAGRRFLTLSYGERRLALLARTLASRPKLLLLDELLNGLDEINHGRALRWLEHTRRSRMPWVLASHRIEDVPAGATHALVLEKGRIVYRGKLHRAPLQRWLNTDHDEPDVVAPPSDERRRQRGHHPQGTRRLPAQRGSGGRRRGAEFLVRLTNADVHLDEHQALRGISLEVHPGECWVVHGRNGSGKTTLLRTLYGDHGVAVGGRIERAGIEPGVPLEEFKRRVGLVAPHLQADHPQQLTVAEVVQSGRHSSIGLNDPPTAADRTAARRSLAFFGLSELAKRTLRELSYGQLRRVLFARAWVCYPDLLLLDEPFAGVDGPTRRSLRNHIEAMVADGTAVVMTTHHRPEWPECVTHELELAGGEARYSGPVRSTGGRASGGVR